MKNVWEHPLFTVLARLVVGAVFIGYGIDKIVAPKDFAHSILNYQILPPPAVNILALLLPWIEVTGGMMLIIGIRLRASAFLLGTLLVTFIVAIGTAMLRGLEINCGCSAHSEPVGLPKILEDCLYLVSCIRIILYPHGLLTLESYVSASEGMATVSDGNEGSAS